MPLRKLELVLQRNTQLTADRLHNVSRDSKDPESLTSSHFLIGSSSIEHSLQDYFIRKME